MMDGWMKTTNQSHFITTMKFEGMNTFNSLKHYFFFRYEMTCISHTVTVHLSPSSTPGVIGALVSPHQINKRCWWWWSCQQCRRVTVSREWQLFSSTESRSVLNSSRSVQCLSHLTHNRRPLNLDRKHTKWLQFIYYTEKWLYSVSFITQMMGSKLGGKSFFGCSQIEEKRLEKVFRWFSI